MPDQISIPDSQIIAPGPEPWTSNQPSIAESEKSNPQSKRKRKSISQEELESGSKRSSMQLDEGEKRVRKQSAMGKASSESIEILLNLSSPTNPLNDQPSNSKDKGHDGIKQTQRRRVFRDGWVLVSDSEVESAQNNPQQVVLPSIKCPAGVYSEQSPNAVNPPPKLTLSSDKQIQSFLEIYSSPLSSPSGFSDHGKGSKSRKNSKSNSTKKPRPKKKNASKPKTKKGQKSQSNDTLTNLADAIPPSATEKCSHVQSIDKSNLQLASLSHNSETELDVSSQISKGHIGSIFTATTSQDLHKQSEAEKVILTKPLPLDEGSTTSKNHPKKSDQPHASSSKSSLQPHQSNSPLSDARNLESKSKITQKKKFKGSSLAEILASTNPKTKRGIRIGLPKEEKHRLHTKINPKPLVQKQVKNKLKLRRGEYDSGEDDQPPKSNKSDSDSGDGKQNREQVGKREDVHDDVNHEQDFIENNDEEDEEY